MTDSEWTDAVTFCFRLKALVEGFRQMDYQATVPYPEHIDAPIIVKVGDYALDKLGPMPEFAIAATELLVVKGAIDRSATILAEIPDRLWQAHVQTPMWWETTQPVH